MKLPLDRPPESLCVLRLSAIGDVCHALAVVRAIQAAWPMTRLTWIIGATEHGLLAGLDGVEFIIFDKRDSARSRRALRRELQGRRFDVLLHMQASWRANLVARCVPADIRLGFDRARARDLQWLFTNARVAPQHQPHVLEGLLSFARTLGVPETPLRWDIPLAEADRRLAREELDSAGTNVIISPCSSERRRNFRNWSPSRYAAVARHAAERHGARVLLTGGNSSLEQEFGRVIAAQAPGARDLIGRTTLKELLALIQGADLLICPDSGPAHMATAVGTPVVGLYATSNARRTGPYFSQALVVDRYREAVQAAFGKPVESVAWGRRVRDPRAMDLIQVEEVCRKVDQALGRPNDPDQRVVG